MAHSSISPPSAANQVAFRLAGEDDAPRIRRLLQTSPFGHRVALTLEAIPAHPHSLTEHRRSRTVVASRPASPQAIVGLAGRDVHSVWFNGRPALVGYLRHFRRKPGEGITLRRLREGFRLLEHYRLPDELPFDFTSILADNAPARRLLERGLPDLPRYEPVGHIATLTFAASHAARYPAGLVRHARREDHDEILALLQRVSARHQLAPCLASTAFECPGLKWFTSFRDRRLTGCAALWDQQSFKTLMIAGYAPWLRRLRVPLNLVRGLTGSPTLPPVGHQLPLAFVSFLAAEPGDLHTIRALLSAASRASDTSCLNFGLPADHPALPALRKSLRPEVASSVIYLVHPPGRDVAAPARTFPIHPEIALL